MADVVREINKESGTVGGGSVSKTLEISVVKVGVSGDVARTMIIDFGQLQAQPTWGSIQGKPTFADVAFSGSYDDLSGLPDLSTKQDKLVSGTNIRTVNGYSLLGEGDVNIQTGDPHAVLYTEQYLTSEQKQTAKTNIGAQDKLVSGTNIKTVNNESLLGSGNIDIQGGGSADAVLYTEQRLTTEQQAQARKNIGAGTYSKPSGGIPSSDIASGVIPDVSGFITKSVNDLTNYYLKSETYTQAEVNALIGAIQQFHYEIYATLPQTGQSNVLYLIGPTGSGADRYEEYVYANNAFTKIGDTSIDLSGYVTTSALNTALADYTTTANLTTLLAGKQDTISDLSTIRSGAALGATAYQKPSTGIPASDLASGVIPSVPVQDVTVGGTSVVSNGTAVIPQEVFWAEYGVTTASEIDAAVSNGKVVFCNVAFVSNTNEHTLQLITYKSSSSYWNFSCIEDNVVYYARVNKSSNNWSNQRVFLQKTIDMVSSWQTTPDDTHYPSEKLVKDYVDGICGDILTILTSI